MIVTKLDPGTDGSARYIITQGSIVWFDDNWYKNRLNALWIQLILAGVKDWVKCKKEQRLSKSLFNFHFVNMLNELTNNIDYGFNSEIKIAANKIDNPLQSRSNKTALKLLCNTLSNVVDSILVPENFFYNPDKGTFIQFVLRQSDRVKHSHGMRLSKMNLSKESEDMLTMLKYECESSTLASEQLIRNLKEKSLRTK